MSYKFSKCMTNKQANLTCRIAFTRSVFHQNEAYLTSSLKTVVFVPLYNTFENTNTNKRSKEENGMDENIRFLIDTITGM